MVNFSIGKSRKTGKYILSIGEGGDVDPVVIASAESLSDLFMQIDTIVELNVQD
jgi:hypothetical protein